MDTDQAEQLAMSFLGATLELPLGPDTDVCKVGGPILALPAPDGDPVSLSLKSDQDFALDRP